MTDDKCKKLGETCYDFTAMWCDDCVKKLRQQERKDLYRDWRKARKENGMTFEDAVNWMTKELDIISKLKE